MLKFFRRIRQKLVDKGNLKKYLLYAVGEILLVMIGILLALRVNTWNENQKISHKATNYLNQIVSNLEDEQKRYNTKYELHQRQIDQFKEAIDLLYSKQNNHQDAVEFYRKLFGQETDDLVPIDATYQEIINSGDIGIFKNKNISNEIVKYYSLEYDAAAQIKEFNEVVSTERTLARTANGIYQLKYLSDYYKYPTMFDDNDWSYLNDTKSLKFKALENILVLNIFRESDHSKRFQNLLEKNRELQDLIHHELNAE